MKFTRDICRLLGLGGDWPVQEELEAQDVAPGPADGRKGSSEVLVNHEGEGLCDEEEKAKRRAERRRAKRKRQKERKRKPEREEQAEELAEQVGEAARVSESDSEEEEEEEEQEQWTPVPPRDKCNLESLAGHLTTEKKNNRTEEEEEEEEPEWDVRSAFVANAANHVKLRGPKNRSVLITKENEENAEDEASRGQGEESEEMKKRAQSLTERGMQMFGQGLYIQAVDMFTEAISCDPRDHRFYGNRSYCYWCLERYSPALRDALRSIQLAPDWPKGYFRKGCALMGLKRYSEAEKAMEQVLKLDPHIKEASCKLVTCRVLQLREMGFEEEQSQLLLEKFITVQAVLTSTEARALKNKSLQDQSGSCRSLWVGNITLQVTEKDLWDLFKMFGEIESIRVLHERFCAFINFQNVSMAAKALEKLQDVELGGSRLVMRYPDRRMQRNNAGLGLIAAATQQGSASTGCRRRATVNGDECVYWRTTGCFYGDKCRFKHVPPQQWPGGKS